MKEKKKKNSDIAEKAISYIDKYVLKKDEKDENKISAYRVAQGTGITEASISNYKSGKSIPMDTYAKTIIDYFESGKWRKVDDNIAEEPTSPYERKNNNINNEVTPVPHTNYKMVEYVDLRAAAGRIGGGEVDQLPDTHKRLVPIEFENGRYLVVRVTGDSMDDGTKRSLSDGDEVLVREVNCDGWTELPIRNRLFVITSREGHVIKQIKEINTEEGYFLCHSFNPIYEDFKLYFRDIHQVFVVYKVVQKQISLI